MIKFNPAYSNINFKSYRHDILDKSGNVINRGDTCFFRWDLDFDYLINYIEYKYRDVKKVNIIAHACSDGEEICSFIAKMIDSLGIINAEKYLPVKARDIEKEHIKLAKKGKYNIQSFEKSAINFYMGENFWDYFKCISPNIIQTTPQINKCVEYKQSDILNDVNEINFNNTVLFARNFWHYLSKEEIENLATNLSNRMNKSSLLVIGDFDKQYNIDNVLYRHGFYETKLKYVFEKIK